jgi:hypothetical protein
MMFQELKRKIGRINIFEDIINDENVSSEEPHLLNTELYMHDHTSLFKIPKYLEKVT